ncbi:MAG: cupin domain-containing protein [Anaerolineae bacterium]
MSDDEHPWEPEPIDVEAFHSSEGWSNINRAPHDRVSGVVYKRGMAIKRVRYEPADPAPDMPDPWQGDGPTIIRWLFSEDPATAEHLLEGRRFSWLQDLELAPGATTGQKAHPGVDTIVYVIDGEGLLYHRPTAGSPIVTRPLRRNDAVLIEESELYSLANPSEGEPLRLIRLGLTRAPQPSGSPEHDA